jgi:hypothetical protein
MKLDFDLSSFRYTRGSLGGDVHLVTLAGGLFIYALPTLKASYQPRVAASSSQLSDA